jgi:arginyl-tRNA synthetase
MEDRIRTAVAAKLAALGAGGEQSVSFTVERPADMAHGDYAVNAALAAAKVLGRNPRELAEDLAGALRESLGAAAARVETAGPGFINITVARDAIAADVERAANEGAEWGKAPEGGSARAAAPYAGKRVMIEYGNPNSFKEMHVGHLMSTIEGEALSRIIENAGATVIRDTFGGDVGPHVAKALWALRAKGAQDIASPKELGDAYIHGSNAYEESEEAHRAIDELNTRIYEVVGAADDAAAEAALSEDDRALLALWRKGREVSMEEFRRLWKILGSRFEYEFFDSDTTKGGISAVMDGVEKGIFEKSEGAIVYKGEKKGLHTLVFITSRATPTYETKDIGLAFLKEERAQTDEIIIVTAVEQIGHFEVVLAALGEIAPLLAAKTRHVPHGLLRLTTGKMSSRKGNIITADGLLRDVIARALEKNEDPLVAEQVGVAAVKYSILKQSAGSDIIFDVEKALSLEGDSGPYLQYALVRAKSVIEKAPNGAAGDGARALPAEPFAIERLIARFPEIAARAARELAPHHIAQYLTQLAGEWNSFYAKERIIGGEYEAYKLAVARAFVQTMRNGLELLGIPAPEKM